MRRSIFVLVITLSGCGNTERPDEEVVIDESALSVYSRDHYPKTYDRWGVAGVERIKKVERAALLKAGKQRKCDRVEYVGLSEQLSNPPDNVVVYADCLNRWRFYINDENHIVQSERTK